MPRLSPVPPDTTSPDLCTPHDDPTAAITEIRRRVVPDAATAAAGS